MGTDELVAASNQIMLKVGQALARELPPREMGILILNKMFGVPLWKIPEEQEFITHMLGEQLQFLMQVNPDEIPRDILGVMYDRIFNFLQEAYRIGGPDVKKLIAAELVTLKAMDVECGKMDEQIDQLEARYREWVRVDPTAVELIAAEPPLILPSYISMFTSLEKVVDLIRLNIRWAKPDGPVSYPITQVAE